MYFNENEFYMKKSSNKSYIVLLVGLIIVLIATVCFFLGTKKDNNTTIISTPTPTVTITPSLKYTINEVIETKNEKFLISKYENKWAGIDQYPNIGEGNQIARFYLEYENIGQETNKIGYMLFSFYADNEYCYNSWEALDSNTFPSYVELSPGRKCAGWVYVIIPETTKSFEIEYENLIVFL